jgi:hypothetical protein
MENAQLISVCSGWRVGLNPYGEGLLLLVDRGIPCEGHVQVFSAHTTNTPEIRDIEVVISERRDELGHAIINFTELMRTFPLCSLEYNRITRDRAWHTTEAIASIFCNHMISSIAKDAEHLFCKRH